METQQHKIKSELMKHRFHYLVNLKTAFMTANRIANRHVPNAKKELSTIRLQVFLP
jgi:hypothetical protein